MDAPVTAVTLYEDRAHVTRSGRVAVAAGTTEVTIDWITPLLVDKSVGARALGGDHVEIVDVRVDRRLVMTPSEPTGDAADADTLRASLERELRALDRELARERALLQAGDERRDALAQLAERTIEDVAVDAAWGRSPEGMAAQLRALEDAEAELERQIVDRRHALAIRERERERLQRRILSLVTPTRHYRASATLVVASKADAEVELALDYLVANACWRPYHTATLDAAGGRLAVSTDGCVWQNTGEDWADVTLRFSTKRASLGARPPSLETDRLVVMARRQQIDVEVRDHAVDTLEPGASVAVADELPGIDDGGEAVTLTAPNAASVPSDGRPHRVPLSRFDCEARTALVAAAELVSAAILESRQRNTASVPLLAGPVDLVRDSGLVGRTSVGYVAPGAPFVLGWGPDALVRVSRDAEEHHEEAKMLSAWDTIQRRVKVRLSNIGPEARVVRVKERVPVSELDKVKVNHDPAGTTDGETPDENGFLEWDVRLDPFGQEALTLAYTVKKHSDIKGL